MIGRTQLIVIISAAVVVSVGAAGALLILGNDDGDLKSATFSLTYYDEGEKIIETHHSSGTSVTLLDGIVETEGTDRFVGWNTRSDMSGSLLASGSQIKMDRDVSLYAMVLGKGVYAVILPEIQKGFSLTADPMIVAEGGSSILSYSLMSSHMDDDLVIAVNGNPEKLDNLNRIYLKNIREDKTVTVAGVFNKLQHSISLPEEQEGYVLTSSADRVHHEESYTLTFELLPGYEETEDFGIHINEVDSRIPSEGMVQIDDVRGDHKITVTGVSAIQYSISQGKNISVSVNGAAADTATINDLITVAPAQGYVIPETFDGQIKGEFTGEGGEYRITGSVVFPSVLKVTVGENVIMTGKSSKTVFVCPNDKLMVSASSGYSMPGNYIDSLKSKNGIAYSASGFSFTDDADLPSIYKIVFNGYNKVHETSFVIDGVVVPLPTNNPQRVAYYFGGWDVESSYIIHDDLSIESIWNPMTHTVFFGPNLSVEIGDRRYMFKENSPTPPRAIEIKSNEEVTIKSIFDLNLPKGFEPYNGKALYVDGHYEILENCSFPGVTYVKYWDLEGIEGETHSVTIGSEYILISEPTKVNEGYVFAGWFYEEEILGGRIRIENKSYDLFANWIT